jgi:uncharacterized damage-inducible protein DinB
MLLSTFQQLFERDLKALSREIEAYDNETDLWLVEKTISNSAGNLCLHLVGNLNHFIGSQLGKSGYVRERELEFSRKNVPKNELIDMINDTRGTIIRTLDVLTEEQLEQDYPLVVFKEKMSVSFFLIHLTTHLAYHLGQINFHRRLLTNE